MVLCQLFLAVVFCSFAGRFLKGLGDVATVLLLFGNVNRYFLLTHNTEKDRNN